MGRKLVKTLQDRIDATMASLAVRFMDAWTIVERSWRRPFAWPLDFPSRCGAWSRR